MSCHDVELLCLEGDDALTAEARAHLEGCPACRAFRADAAAVVAAAALPPPSAQERAALASLPATAWAAWTRRERRRGLVQQVLGYAMAASLGAVVASAALWQRGPGGVVAVSSRAPEAVAFEAPYPPPDFLEPEDLDVPDDEVFFEVTWPQTAEGENP